MLFSLEINKAKICELLGCFNGTACSEMCSFLLCSSFLLLDWLQLLIIPFSCCTWALSSTLKSPRTEKLLWLLPVWTTTAQSCELIFCAFFQARAMLNITPASRVGSLCHKQRRWRLSSAVLQHLVLAAAAQQAVSSAACPACWSAAFLSLPQPRFIGLDCVPIKLIYLCVLMKNWTKLPSHSCIYRCRSSFSQNSMNYWLLWASFKSQGPAAFIDCKAGGVSALWHHSSLCGREGKTPSPSLLWWSNQCSCWTLIV